MKCDLCEAKVYLMTLTCEAGHHYVKRADEKEIVELSDSVPTRPLLSIPPQKDREEQERRDMARATNIRWPFGKHKGTLIEDLPSDYIEWVLENFENLSNSHRKLLEEQLILRGGGGVAR